MGETEFETVPERIVVLDSPQMDALVALGITPVGAPEIGAGRGFPAYLADDLDGTESIGFIAEPDVDAIANLAPDVIIGSKVRHEALYEELSAIAPTVFSEDTGTNWTEQAVLTAAAVKQSDAMDQLIKGVEDRAAEVGTSGRGRRHHRIDRALPRRQLPPLRPPARSRVRCSPTWASTSAPTATGTSTR